MSRRDWDWDWSRMLTMRDFNELAFAGFPGWGKLSGNILAVLIECRAKVRDSHFIAAEWDDISNGVFYYRDKTSGGTPFVDGGERYLSLFYFQFVDDAALFAERYQGNCNWGEDRKIFLQKLDDFFGGIEPYLL